MSALNVPNRTLAIMDNLRFLRALNNECVDLIVLDPPYAANEAFTRYPKLPISDGEYAEEAALAEAHGAAHNEGRGAIRVSDYWNWSEDIRPAWKMAIADDHPAVHAVIAAVEQTATENEAAYIAFMAPRLLECYRALKPTGSIYLHCGDRVNSHLRLLMDAVFGPDNFQNELVWRRNTSNNDAARRFGRTHDTIWYYAKSENYTWTDEAREAYDEDYITHAYQGEDEYGRFATAPLHARGLSGGGLEFEWRTIQDVWRFSRERLNEMDAAGQIHWPRQGRMPRRKVYLDDARGMAARDLILDIRTVPRRESTGYPSQKPLELYERIIAASSHPGDVVLDAFAGCATTLVAAERLGRQWLGCDLAYRSWTILKRRFYLNGVLLEGTTDATIDALAAARKERTSRKPAELTPCRVIGPPELPARDDADPPPRRRQPRRPRKMRASVQSSGWSGRISREDAKQLLIARFGPVCWGCGYDARRPNGSVDDSLLEVDHIRAQPAPESAPGDDAPYSLALLHRTCRGIKRNRLTLAELRQHNEAHGLLYADSVSELVDPEDATRFAAEEITGPPRRRGRGRPRKIVRV